MLVRAALPHLRAQGGGRIIGLSTFGGQAVLPGGSLYHASKWGLEGFLDSLSIELAAFKIGVTIIEPGSARTNFRFGGARAWEPQRLRESAPPKRKLVRALPGFDDRDPDLEGCEFYGQRVQEAFQPPFARVI